MDQSVREKIGDTLCDIFRAYLGQSASIKQLERLRPAADRFANYVEAVCQQAAAVICGRLQRVVADGFKAIANDMSKVERDMERLEEKMQDRLYDLEKKIKAHRVSPVTGAPIEHPQGVPVPPEPQVGLADLEKKLKATAKEIPLPSAAPLPPSPSL
jgi:hypothetical protein